VTALDPDGDLDAAGGPALTAALAGLTKARACFARTAFEYYRLRPSVDADSCALRTLESAATDGGNLRAFFLANVANEDIFWKGN
jgi:nucleoid-associated protein YejK